MTPPALVRHWRAPPLAGASPSAPNRSKASLLSYCLRRLQDSVMFWFGPARASDSLPRRALIVEHDATLAAWKPRRGRLTRQRRARPATVMTNAECRDRERSRCAAQPS